MSRFLLWVGLCLSLMACTGVPDPSTTKTSGATDSGKTAAMSPTKERSFDVTTLMPRDAIQAIVSPTFVHAKEAETLLLPDDEVIGVEIAGEAKAYPVALLRRHEIVNDVVGGTPIVVTYCPMCATGIVYHRTVNGTALTFGVSGKVALNSMIMYDHETESLWSQVIGKAIEGPLKTTKLQLLVATQTSWQSWQKLQPTTLVLSNDLRPRNFSSVYETALTAPVFGATARPHRNINDYVVGVALGNEAVAYPFATLRQSLVVNDLVAGTPLTLIFDPETGMALAWERPIHEGALLTFTPVPSAEFVVQDTQTGSQWSGLTGKAIDGPLAGRQLTQVPRSYSFWLGWVDAYPQTRLFQVGG